MEKKALKKSIRAYLHKYLTGEMTMDEFISKHLSGYITIDGQKEREIKAVLVRYGNIAQKFDTTKSSHNKQTRLLYKDIVNDVYNNILALYESPIIAQLRVALNHLNPAEVARRSGVSGTTINNWLDGKSNPRLSRIEAVINAINEIKSEMEIKINQL